MYLPGRRTVSSFRATEAGGSLPCPSHTRYGHSSRQDCSLHEYPDGSGRNPNMLRIWSVRT